MGFHNEYNADENTILCSSSGAYAGFISKYDKKVWTSDCFSIIPKNNSINNTYLYYLLKTIQYKIYKLQTGTAQPHIYSNDLQYIKIPIPSLERQQEIVKYLDFIYEKANKTSNEKISELKKLNEFCLNNQKIFGDNVVKTLGEVCNFKNGKGIKKDTLIEGEYPVIGGGQKPMGFHNEYNTNENAILCSSSGAYAGFISKYDKKVWTSDCFSIIPNDKSIDNNYLYYLLKTIQDKIYKTQSGAAQPHIYSKDLQNIKITIPPLDKQKEIVEYCEYNDTVIKQLKKEIENNKALAQQFINGIVKSHIHDEITDSFICHNTEVLEEEEEKCNEIINDAYVEEEKIKCNESIEEEKIKCYEPIEEGKTECDKIINNTSVKEEKTECNEIINHQIPEIKNVKKKKNVKKFIVIN
jgi:type I restriction enzyme S subunit